MSKRDQRATATPSRPPWYTSGWREDAEAWIQEQLAQTGRATTGVITEQRLWALSCVLRVPTDLGAVYFKATADLPLFTNEPLLTSCLERMLPGSVPRLVAVDATRGWMLSEEFADVVGWDAPADDVVGALAQWAHTQRRTADRADDLLAASCHDCRLDGLADRVGALAADDRAVGVLPPGTAGSLKEATDTIGAVCDVVASGGIPDCLVHGDLHMGNVGRGNHGYVFFDWTDACVSHPFMDGLLPYRLADAAVKDRARDAILAAWVDVAPLSELRETWDLARLACLAHHAVSFGSLVATVPTDLLDDLGTFFATIVDELLVAVDDAR